MSLDRRTAPDLVAWGTGDHLALKDVQTIALDGDRVYGPASVSETYSKYQSIKATIDPSGEGKDETTLTIGALLHSTVFVLKQAGWLDGHSETTLKEIANLLVEYNVQSVRVEDNFGQGMFAQLLKPYLKEAWEAKDKQQPRPFGENRKSTEIITERAQRQQKELRIISALEGALNNHRIVMSKELLLDDYRVANSRAAQGGGDLSDRYSLMYQLTRITREPKCLSHDDRIEGFAELVKLYAEQLGLMAKEGAEKAEEKRIEEELEKLFKETDRISRASFARKKLRGGLRGGGARR
ncbi:phage terminase large subunit [Ochrobactrum tritici]|nr:phage terminase large subunit [Brucella tritici]